jgi:hypothetical protein
MLYSVGVKLNRQFQNSMKRGICSLYVCIVSILAHEFRGSYTKVGLKSNSISTTFDRIEDTCVEDTERHYIVRSKTSSRLAGRWRTRGKHCHQLEVEHVDQNNGSDSIPDRMNHSHRSSRSSCHVLQPRNEQKHINYTLPKRVKAKIQ